MELIQELKPGTNTGFIEVRPRDSDWLAGEESGILYQEANPSGDWSDFLPSEERQRKNFDTMACVSFSALNVLEAQMNLKLASLPEDLKNWLAANGYVEGGKVNFSDRYVAKLSGTTRTGNSLVNVWDTIRKHGLVPENDWKFDGSFDWVGYYAEVPAMVLAKGQEFLKRFSVMYEWIPNHPGSPATTEVLKKHLKQCPIQIATAICPGWWNADRVEACGLPVSHATMLYGIGGIGSEDERLILDTYPPFRRRLTADYGIPFLMKGLIEVKTAPNAQNPVKFQFKTNLRLGERGDDIRALQVILKALGMFPANVECTGFYGKITASAVLAFQLKYEVDSPMLLRQLAGKIVGPKTRAELNKLSQ